MARYSVAGSDLQSNTFARHSLSFSCVSSLLALAGALSFSSAFAADSADAKAKSNGKGAAVRDRDLSESVPIPECIEKLNLTAKQQEQIRGIVREYDESINSVWNQFRDRYMQTIAVETSLLSAIEDHLTDGQQKQIREHRRMTAQHKRVAATTDEKPAATVKSEPSADKPGTDVKVDVANFGVTLTQEQEAAADKVHQKYRNHLRSMNRSIHNLHNRLVSLEASKLAEIEQVLTKEQLTQLRANRQEAPDAAKITISRNDSTKTE